MKKTMTPPELLASFAALADDLSYTRAAARLHLAQPALTKRIQQLERALGLSLFVRTRRSVRLSSAGELLLPKARQVLRSLDDLDGCARRLVDGSLGRLRIGFSPSAPHHVLPRLMRAFRVEHPGVECLLSELPSDQQLDQLLDGEIDVGILRPPATVPRALRCRVFLEEPYVAVLPRDHALAARRRVPLSKLAADPFVLVSRRSVAGVHDQVLAACAEAGFTPRSLREATHVHAVVSLVAAGCGVSVLPASAAQLGVSDIVCRPLRDVTPRTVMAVAHPKQGAQPAALALADAAQRLGTLAPRR